MLSDMETLNSLFITFSTGTFNFEYHSPNLQLFVKANLDRNSSSSLPGTKVNLSIRRYSQAHVFSRHVVILCILNIPEVSVRCPYKVRRVKRHVEWRGRVVPHSGIFPPLAEENIHAVLLE